MRRLLALALLAIPGIASANFHLMQIEQVIGGVGGDTTQQAVQLRLRFTGQNVVSQAQIRVVDAAGMNPITLVDMTTDVTMNVQGGARILIASPNFIAQQGATADFVFAMSTLIPPSYFDGGQIQFLHDTGTRYWLLCWGNYSGSTSGNISNDTDGVFGPCASTTLPFSGVQALKFLGSASAMSTTNLADYALTAGAAVFTNNAGAGVTVHGEAPLFADDFE
jgi:hypothetical protein